MNSTRAFKGIRLTVLTYKMAHPLVTYTEAVEQAERHRYHAWRAAIAAMNAKIAPFEQAYAAAAGKAYADHEAAKKEAEVVMDAELDTLPGDEVQKRYDDAIRPTETALMKVAHKEREALEEARRVATEEFEQAVAEIKKRKADAIHVAQIMYRMSMIV